jgi:hypothetical protein
MGLTGKSPQNTLCKELKYQNPWNKGLRAMAEGFSDRAWLYSDSNE